MNLKNIILILIICLVLICSINAINAISEENDVGLNQTDDLISVNDDEQLSVADDDTLTAPQYETTLQATTDNQEELKATTIPQPELKSTAPAAAKPLTPYQQFVRDLESGQGTVYLTGDIKISKHFELWDNVVIDGQGNTIDGQSKTNMFRVYRCTVTIKNTIFTNGYAEQGGAIYCLYGNLNIYDCTFIKNVAYDNGGAIYHSTGNLVVSGSTFTSNKVYSSRLRGHGGAIYFYKGYSKISKSTFKYNYCLSKSLKKHSKATKYQFAGGALYLNEGSHHKLTQCQFIGNKASNHGGAVYAFKPKSLTINKCTFKKNRVVFEDGGAITFNGKKLVIKDSKFYGNKAYEDGGVMDALSLSKHKTYITITGCVFQGNMANKGGGVFWMGIKSVWTMKNNKFIKNKATIGGTFLAEDAIAKIYKCLFQGNMAKKVTSWSMKAKDGHVLKFSGGVLLLEKRSVKFTKCTFKSNSATYGGVVFHKSGKLTFSKNKFSANKGKGAKVYPS